jgi:spermidine/putrescine transport system substrate-binding protein
MKAKSAVSLLACACLLFWLPGVLGACGGGPSINVCNWGDYMALGEDGGMDVLKEFQERSGIKVNYDTFDTNESLYATLAGGGVHYDVIFSSDYMIQRLIEEGRLRPLNYESIPNYRYIPEEFRDPYYDPGNAYSVPYTYGTAGLIYNEELVEGIPDSWAALWDPRYAGQILQFASPRDAFGVAQLLLGQDANTLEPADWRAAAEKLKEQAPLLQRYVAEDIYNIMEGGNAAIAPFYAGDCAKMIENASVPLGFAHPKEGTNFFYDAVSIPSDARNAEGAELFINFLLEPDVALANAEVTMYAVPHSAVRENPAYSLRGNPYIYPDPAELPPVQYYEHLPQDILTLMNNLWTAVKQS